MTAERSPSRRGTYDEALRLLERKARSTSELRQRLVRRGHAAADVEGAVDRLLRVGLLDDGAYAEQFARSRLAAGATAPGRIERELLHRGIDRRTIAAALDRVVTDERIDLTAILDDLTRRRAESLGRLDPGARRRRLYGYLARRGFNADDIRGALSRVLRAD